jgi:hypothetical protein
MTPNQFINGSYNEFISGRNGTIFSAWNVTHLRKTYEGHMEKHLHSLGIPVWVLPMPAMLTCDPHGRQGTSVCLKPGTRWFAEHEKGRYRVDSLALLDSIRAVRAFWPRLDGKPADFDTNFQAVWNMSAEMFYGEFRKKVTF